MNRTKILATALTIAVASAASPAKADWQYTRWGMTPAQVAQASSGAVQVGSGDPDDATLDGSVSVGAVGTYSSGTHRFRAVFYFDQGALSGVKLTLQASGCGRLWADMTSAYGAPFEESDSDSGHRAQWHADRPNLRVFLVEIGALCLIDYYPLRTANSRGL